MEGCAPFCGPPWLADSEFGLGLGLDRHNFRQKRLILYIFTWRLCTYICTLSSVLCILLNAFVFRLSCWQHFIFYSFFIYQQKTEIVIIYIFLDNLVIISFSKCLWYTPLFDMYVYEYYIMYILDSTVRL